MHKKLLISKMKLHGDTQIDLAKALGIAVPTVNAKINGTNGAEFRISEMNVIFHRYDLTPEELVQIFLEDDSDDLDSSEDIAVIGEVNFFNQKVPSEWTENI